uniref:Uncharacterized protein n=3 Tax=Oryza TaxID=4527 RepID=A0A0E0PD63_ORYRU
MILVAVVAELLEEYTVLVARVLEQLFNDAPFPRRMRFLMLRSLPFVPPPLPPPPPSHALRGKLRVRSKFKPKRPSAVGKNGSKYGPRKFTAEK